MICTGTALDVDDEDEPEPDEGEPESEDEALPEADEELEEEDELELEEDELDPEPTGRTFTNRFHASHVNSSAEVHSEVFGMRVMLPTGSKAG